MEANTFTVTVTSHSVELSDGTILEKGESANSSRFGGELNRLIVSGSVVVGSKLDEDPEAEKEEKVANDPKKPLATMFYEGMRIRALTDLVQADICHIKEGAEGSVTKAEITSAWAENDGLSELLREWKVEAKFECCDDETCNSTAFVVEGTLEAILALIDEVQAEEPDKPANEFPGDGEGTTHTPVIPAAPAIPEATGKPKAEAKGGE